MSVTRCEKCEEWRDTDFITECENCADDLAQEFNEFIEGGFFDSALRVYNKAIDLDIELETEDEMYLNWLKQQEYELEQGDNWRAL